MEKKTPKNKYQKWFRSWGSHRRLNPAAASQRVAAVSAVALQSLASVQRIIRGVADDGFEDRREVSTSV
jgi:hypothetical protein